jgi:hypothetical protein
MSGVKRRLKYSSDNQPFPKQPLESLFDLGGRQQKTDLMVRTACRLAVTIADRLSACHEGGSQEGSSQEGGGSPRRQQLAASAKQEEKSKKSKK